MQRVRLSLLLLQRGRSDGTRARVDWKSDPFDSSQALIQSSLSHVIAPLSKCLGNRHSNGTEKACQKGDSRALKPAGSWGIHLGKTWGSSRVSEVFVSPLGSIRGRRRCFFFCLSKGWGSSKERLCFCGKALALFCSLPDAFVGITRFSNAYMDFVLSGMQSVRVGVLVCVCIV